MEAYAAYALRAWLARDQAISGRTRRFAKWSAICSFVRHGRVAYHLMAQAGMGRAPWAITTIVSCLPVLDSEGKCVGIVAAHDLLGWCMVRCAGAPDSCAVPWAA